MEVWSALIASYPEAAEPKHLAKALHTADSLLSMDLAPFEIEWLVSTLLYQPVDVINIIISNRGAEIWLKSIADSFRVISKIVVKYWHFLENHCEDIVKLCMHSYDAQTKKEAIHCLINVLKNPGVNIGDAKGQIDALEMSNTCVGPLALLVGTICRYYPESVDQYYIRIWRIYLKMLQPTNVTDMKMSAILQGIDGLFENFGTQLPTNELNDFYNDLSRKCARISKCIEPLLSILKTHAGLFKERLREDRVLRLYLWGINSPNMSAALLSIYAVVFEDLTDNEIKNIIRLEVQDKTSAENSLVRHTALRVVISTKTSRGVQVAGVYRPDELEFHMRHRMISYQDADLIALCLESHEGYTRSLLETTIRYYDNIPATLRRRVVVKGILEASEDNRKMALKLLIELSRQDGGLEKYSEVWRGILDPEVETKSVLEETVHQILFLLKSFLDHRDHDLAQVLSLSAVLSFVLCVSKTGDGSQYCGLLKPVLLELSGALSISSLTLLSPQFACVEMFENDNILKELISSLNENIQFDCINDLSMMQTIFSRDVVDTKLLIKAISEMDRFLKTGSTGDRRLVINIMKEILKLKSKKDVSSSDNRILLRNIAMFAGEHSDYIEKENFLDDIYLTSLKNKITINVTAGTDYKIDLLRILQISLVSEDPETLYCLLVIISANLLDRPDPGLQGVAWRCIHGLLKCKRPIDMTPVLQMCASIRCIQQAIDSISNEVDPEVRRTLCDGLQVMFAHNPGSEAGQETMEQVLTMVAEQLLEMISSTDQFIYKCGLDITRAFLTTLRQNNDFTLTYLPKILSFISRYLSKELYEMATDLFLEKIAIFDDDTVKETVIGIIKHMKLNKNKIHLEYILMFLKKIYEAKRLNVDFLVDEVLRELEYVEKNGNVGEFANVVQILALSKTIFGFDENLARLVTTKHNSVVIEGMFKTLDATDAKDVIHVTSNILKFLNEYAVVLIEDNREQSIRCLSKVIENITPTSVPILKNDLTVCLSTYKRLTNSFPDEIKQSFEKWCEKLNINEINMKLNEFLSQPIPMFDISDDFDDKIQSLSVMCSIFDIPIVATENWTKKLMENDEILRHDIVSRLLLMSVKCANLSQIKNLLKNNRRFVERYLNVYFEKILDNGMEIDKNLFVHLLKFFVNKYVDYSENYDKMVDLIEKNWSLLDEETFEEKLAIASDFLRLPKDSGLIAPVQWLLRLITAENTSLDDKIKMITILPGREECSSCYRHMAGFLPTRLSEMRDEHAAVLRALLNCLASSGDLTILDIVITLAAADDTKGWWDDAIDACMASLAGRREEKDKRKKIDEKIYDAAYRACKRRSGLGGCRRVFVPLLRHSTRAACEEYASKIIEDVLSTLRTGFKEPSNTEIYRERVLSYAKAFAIIQVIIEKLTPENLETGILNVVNGVRQPWYVVKTVCTLSVTLMDKVRCPDNASCEIRKACLGLQCAAYNCLTTAICKRRPSQKQYTFVFNENAWSKVVDPDVEYEFKPRAYWGDSRSTRKVNDGSRASSSFTATVRTRLFLTTLSENPLQYDLIPNEEEDEDVQDNSPTGYENHPLNTHGCLATITTLLQHASTLEHTEWLTRLTNGLMSCLPLNAKWTLAQAICNAEADLTGHASVLTPALLELVATTPKVTNNKQVLNNLHIDILWTIIKWKVSELTSYQHLSTSVEYLIHTCIEFRSQETVSRRLLNTLNSLLQVYGTKIQIPWTVFKEYCDELPQSGSYLLPIFQRILKHGIPLPDLIPVLFTKFDAQLWTSTSRLPDVFGLALSLEVNEEHLAKFWQILASVKTVNVVGFVKLLMYAQRVCSRCCNGQLFRIIVGLAPKLEKSRCLAIIATYLDNLEIDHDFCSEVFDTIALRELLDGDCLVEAMKVVHGGFKFMDDSMRSDVIISVGYNCRSASTAVRKQAFTVMLKVFQDLVGIKQEHGPKRQATSGTPILNTRSSTISYHKVVVEEVSRGMFDDDEDIAKMMRQGVDQCLSKDMVKRLAELFYLIFYFAKTECSELSEYGYVFLELLFSEIKQQEGFKNKKISEHSLPASVDKNVYTIRTSGVTNKQKTMSKVNERRHIDIQMPVGEIFEAFLQGAKSNSQICHELCVQIMWRLEAEGSSPRFDIGEIMGKLLADVLRKEPNCLTPLFLETSRIFLNSVCTNHEFKTSLNVLKNKMCGDALLYYNIVYEDFILKTEGRKYFQFSITDDTDVDMKYEGQEFSIQGLTEVFGCLSNWDQLRSQNKRRIEESLPPLLVEQTEFERSLNDYYGRGLTALEYNNWFNKMVGVYCSNKLGKTLIQYKENWLKEAQRWPTRDFVTSAVIEAMKWPDDGPLKVGEMKSSECLAEWAARLMMRSSYYSDEGQQTQCRADELRWCVEANRRQLPLLALQCINRNKNSLIEEEAMPWFHQKVEAHRILALKKNDATMLYKALEVAEGQQEAGGLHLKKLILQLKQDLRSLSNTDFDNIVFENFDSSLRSTERDNLKSIYDIAMKHYDDIWDDSENPQEIVLNMLDVIGHCLRDNLSTEHNLLISILLNRLANYDGTLNEDIATKILDKVVEILPNLDVFTVGHIKRISSIFPGNVWSKYRDMDEDPSLGLCKEYLRLICDPQYTLLQYCSTLLRTRDPNDWENTFKNMKETIFDTNYGGTDYIYLTTIKNKMSEIENGCPEERHKTVQNILEELRQKPERAVLRLSQLSPQLQRPEVLEEQAHNLRKLLSLPPTVNVFKFTEQVHVFTDSKRRPCKVTVTLSNGAIRRYIIKTGEPLANDASVQRAIAILPKLFNSQIRSYNVTTLSEESAIIEFLEDYDRLRKLIEKRIILPEVTIADDRLVLSPAQALEEYNVMCNRLPVYTIRAAIENTCASTEEFISKKLTFLQTFSSMTITNWLFGVGDRHLENIMFNSRDGGVCGVDWASVFQYGLREFVPARLTAGLLAVCDVQVLEARLQSMLENLRKFYKLYEAFVKISFYWKGEDFNEMRYISNILQGKILSYQITREVLEESRIIYKEESLKILDTVFNDVQLKETYSIEEQVSNLLQHCTDPRLLAVIPRGWEPWI